MGRHHCCHRLKLLQYQTHFADNDEKPPKNQKYHRRRMPLTIPLFITSLPSSDPLVRWRLPGSRANPVHSEMTTTHHMDLLLVALLYGCAFSVAFLVAVSLALLAFLAGALLVALALAASDARKLAGPAARVAAAATADLRLARAVAVYAVVKAAVRVALVTRPKVGALASRVGRRLEAAERPPAWARGFGFVLQGCAFR
ncbi:unnamed protein product [Urochloa humidicola]